MNLDLARWYFIPGLIQGTALYWLGVEMQPDDLLGGYLGLVWWMAIAPTCLYLTTTADNRGGSLAVSAIIGAVLGLLVQMQLVSTAGDQGILPSSGTLPTPGTALVCSLAIAFITLPFYQSLIQRKRALSDYATLFELAWNQTIHLLAGSFFALITFALLALTVALFGIVGVDLEDILLDSGRPATLCGGAFALAIGISRTHDGIVLGIRALVLSLLRLLLPVHLVITGVFVVIASLRGLDAVDTGLSVAAILLVALGIAFTTCSAAVGDAQQSPGTSTSVLCRCQAALCLPMALLAAYALWVRIDDYGLSGARIIAALLVLVALLYAVAYLLAAAGRPESTLPKANTAMAIVTLAVALFVMSPLLNVQQLAVDDQMARVSDGRITPEQLDLGWLKHESGQPGRDALERVRAWPEASQPAMREQLSWLDETEDPWRYRQRVREAERRSERAELVQQRVDAGSLRIVDSLGGTDTAGGTATGTGTGSGSGSNSNSNSNSNTANDKPEDTLRQSVYQHRGFRSACLEEQKDCVLVLSNSIELGPPDPLILLFVRTGPDALQVARLSRRSSDDEDSFDPPWDPVRLPEPLTATAASIERLFDELSRGELPLETVQTQALVIGTHRVVPSGNTNSVITDRAAGQTD